MILGAAKHTVTRYAAGTTVAGQYVRGATSTFTVRGSLQPATGKEMQLLPEGARSDTKYMLFCDTRQTPLLTGDYVTVAGSPYLVRHIGDWTLHAPRYRAYGLGEKTSV